MSTCSPAVRDLEETLVYQEALLDEWVALGTQIASLEARRAEVLADRLDLLVESRRMYPQTGEMAFRSMTAQYAAAGHLPQRTTESLITEAWLLVRQYPATLDALASGSITRRHADVIISEGPSASVAEAESVRAEYEAQAIPFAQNDTAARTRVHARGVTARLCPETLAEQHRRARSERTVTVTPDGDGMAVLTAILPELLAYAVHDRLTTLARQVRTTRPKPASPAAAPHSLLSDPSVFDPSLSDSHVPASEPVEEAVPADAIWSDADPLDDRMGITEADTRSMDQLRADIFADLLLTTDPTTVTETAIESLRATVHVTIAATTITGSDDRMAELEGHGPLSADAARSLAGHTGSWDRLFLDPRGMTVATDNYVPTSGMKRFLRARDQHCRFPGCRAPAHRCQIDHNFDHAKGGRTELGNLALFCTSHHPLKHPDVEESDRWSAQQLDSGVILWTSPLGRAYTDEPPLRVMFV